jgi:hypothetical protein
MSYVEMAEIVSVRELTDTELATVAGGGTGFDLLKIAGGLIGALAGGPWGAAAGASTVVMVGAIYDAYDSSVPAGSGVNTNIADAAL